MRRVVVTGLGVVSPVGSGPAAFWRNLTAGQSGIGPITLFDVRTFPVRIGGQVRDLDSAGLAQRFPAAAGERDRKIWLGLAAAEQALTDAGLATGDHAAASVHVGVGLEVFFLEDITVAAGAETLGDELVRRVLANPTAPPFQTPLDRLTQLIGDHFGLGGGRYTNCSACAAGAQAIGEAFRQIRSGQSEIALAGGADSMLNPLGLGGFSLLRVLSAENDHPTAACRPFDATREGTVLGEGAAFLVLESAQRAAARRARSYAEVVGYGSAMDAFRVSDPEPSGRGAVLSMSRALRDAELSPAEIDCVNAHATGTPKNDAVETAAIKEVLGPRARAIPVHAVKSMTGHLIAASGAVEAVAAVLTLHERTVPPTINLRTPDPECDLDYVEDGARPFAGQTVLSNSFGFGGQNATLVFRRTAESPAGESGHA
jgi:3-oxoacyl-[acyl-carrier-protein] synthase II